VIKDGIWNNNFSGKLDRHTYNQGMGVEEKW
jgi:hypothetical protein